MKVDYLMHSSLPGKSLAESIAKVARVSNPDNQHNDATAERLIRYLIKNAHWSPFEMFHLTLEIETSRAIAHQIIRHRSFSFQEFSQRYAEATTFEPIELRMQGESKQGGEELYGEKNKAVRRMIADSLESINALYRKLVSEGISRETARFILPEATTTRLYMCGSIRSWIHYIQVRTHPHTQKEHREIALRANDILTNLIDIQL